MSSEFNSPLPVFDEEAAQSKPETETPGKHDSDMDKDRDEDLDIDYPKGLYLVTLTLGLMAFVLMVALDNYILGAFRPYVNAPDPDFLCKESNALIFIAQRRPCLGYQHSFIA